MSTPGFGTQFAERAISQRTPLSEGAVTMEGLPGWKEEGVSAGTSQGAGLGDPPYQLSATCLRPNSAAPGWGDMGCQPFPTILGISI